MATDAYDFGPTGIGSERVQSGPFRIRFAGRGGFFSVDGLVDLVNCRTMFLSRLETGQRLKCGIL